jgi:hypothetical protein
MKICRVMAFAGAFAMLSLAGCGGPSASGVSSSAQAALTGNWNIVGTGQFPSVPSLSLAIFVNGNQITAQGQELIGCATGGAGGGLSLAGQIASDGTFQLTQTTGTTLTLGGSVVQVAVSGSVPVNGAANWSGKYSITVTPTSGCIASQSGAFTATAIPEFSGTYTGQLVQASAGSTGVSASVSVMQGEPTAAPIQVVPSSQSYLPLTGTITVSGVSCFSHGTMTSNTINFIDGTRVTMNFTMDDGSRLALLGSFAGADESKVQLTALSVGTACNLASSTTFTRQ